MWQAKCDLTLGPKKKRLERGTQKNLGRIVSKKKQCGGRGSSGYLLEGKKHRLVLGNSLYPKKGRVMGEKRQILYGGEVRA